MRAVRTFFLLLLVCAWSCGGEAYAGESAKEDARNHFRAGVVLFDQRRFADALSEFERSYALYPDFSTLFNIGQVHAVLGHPVEAVDALESFLSKGGDSIPAADRQRVQAELAAQRAKIGLITFDVLPNGTEVRVDGVPIGKSPLVAPLRFASGPHRVEAMLEGYRAEVRTIDLAGGQQAHIGMSLQSIAQVPSTPAPAPVSAPQHPVEESSQPPLEASDSPPTNPPVSRNWQKLAGYGVGGLGLLGAGVGTYLLIDGQSKHEDALEQWAAGDKAEARQTEQDSVDEKDKGYVVVGVGGAIALGGVILLLTAPSDEPSGPSVGWAPWVGPSVVGVGANGVW